MKTTRQKNIAIFASGGGSNALKIMEYFQNSTVGKVILLVGNKKEMGAYEKAEKFGVPFVTLDKSDFYEKDETVKMLQSIHIDLIVLAGFLWLIPESLIKAFPKRIINIHPALLPAFGGKGMYGHHIHEAVCKAGETKSGMTIHYVNEKFDEGEVIFQAECQLETNETPESIAEKVLALEHRYYPPIVEKVLNQLP